MAPPVVSGLNPNHGPAAGGNTVVITGSGFVGVSKVSFGITPATYVFNSSTKITATAPPVAVPTTVNVTVTTSGGTSTQTVLYTYLALPAVSEVVPDAGPLAGGNTVTIHGTNLAQASFVRFGQVAAASFSVITDNQLTVTAPAGSGIVPVSVTTPGGVSRTSSCGLYSYLGTPVIISLDPDEGRASGGESIVLTGSSFTYAAKVLFNEISVPFSVVSDSQTVIRTPAGSGTVTVTVVNALGAGSPGVPFTYR